MTERRDLEEVIADVKLARAEGKKLGFTPEEIAVDMLVVLEALESDLLKYISKGMEAPAKRARRNTKILETLSKNFRVQSVNFTKEGNIK